MNVSLWVFLIPPDGLFYLISPHYSELTMDSQFPLPLFYGLCFHLRQMRARQKGAVVQTPLCPHVLLCWLQKVQGWGLTVNKKTFCASDSWVFKNSY